MNFVKNISLIILVSTSIATFTTGAIAECKAPKLKQGLPYTQARKIILKSGFYTPKPPAYGYSETDEKVGSDCETVAICNKYPEIESCGTGNCRMTFTDAYGNNLLVFTYGELADGSASVTGSEITCKK